MIITRHNYEEYFILYMDNELGSEDRRLVELFVQENADLKEELDWLLHSRLVPDASLVFDNKEQLMKISGAEPISAANYEEWLLLYTDNELTDEQKIAVEKFAADHPAIQEELALLQKTKFYPEQEIIFHDKEVLYRKEEKVRVITISWRRIAVAAAILIAIGTTALVVYNKKDDSIKGLASGEKTGIKSTPENSADQQIEKTIPNPNTNQVAVENNTDKIDVNKKAAEVNNQTATIDKKIIAPKEKNIRPSVLLIKEDAPVVVDNNNPDVSESIRKDNPIAEADILSNRSLTNSTENIQPSNVTPGNGQSLDNVVTAASVESIDPTDAEPGKKNKLRGFFRKVTRTFEKTTNIKATDDEDRLLLGGLAIKL